MRSLFQSSSSKLILATVAILGLSLNANADIFRAKTVPGKGGSTEISQPWNNPATWEKQDPSTQIWGSAGADFPGGDDQVTIDNNNKVILTTGIAECYSLTIIAPSFSSGNSNTLLDVNDRELRVYGNITVTGGSTTGNNDRTAELLISNNGTVILTGTISPSLYPTGGTDLNKINVPLNSQIIIDKTISPLPVELVSFKALKNTSGVSLTWATASEKNNTGFEVQSSVDGKNYEAIGFVASVNGTSSSLQRYAFTDKAANKEGLVYYRLKQIDLDGTFEYFTAKVVDLGRTASAITAYPNPFQNQFSVNLTAATAEAAVITVSDMTGKTVYTSTAPLQKGSNTLNVTLKDQPAGIYMLNATTGNQTYINRLVKQ